ncbi:MAG TPA: rhodanese-like domain-containing protein [Cellvibrio sp.]|nr:rhodanese-like domain-containing protein [Cellvibrio sp.]
MNYKQITAQEFSAGKTADTCVLDVRTIAEAKALNLPGSLHIPLHELTPARLQEAIAQSGKNGQCVYLLCQSGKRAQMATEQLRGNLEAELVVIEGGINALKTTGLPLNEGNGVMSLERQVRIAAGLLVLAGVVLGFQISANFFLLSGFVGAGLVFAGITDTCMMGMLLARMPWNR